MGKTDQKHSPTMSTADPPIEELRNIPEAPELNGHWLLKQEIGQGVVESRGKKLFRFSCFAGTYGRVFLAQSVETGELMAVKRQLIRTEDASCLNEVKILHLLGESDPHFLKLVDMKMDENSRYFSLVMPLFENHMRWEHLAKLNKSEFQAYANALFSALTTLHSHGFVHRDVKPSNFLCRRHPSLSGRLQFALVDFGLSQQVFENRAKPV